MAIAKMKKIKLISFQNQKDAILEGIQSLQSIELIDMSAEYAEVNAMSVSSRDYFESQSKEWEEKYNSYQDLLSFLRPYLPQPKMLTKLRTPKEMLTIQEMQSELSKVDKELILKTLNDARQRLKQNDQEVERLNEEESFLLKWQKLEHIPSDIVTNEYVGTLTGVVPQTVSDSFIREIKNHKDIFVEEVFQTKDEYGITVAFDRKFEQEVNKVLDENHFAVLHYPFEEIPEIELNRISEEKTQIIEDSKTLKEQLGKMQKEEWVLKLMVEISYAELQRARSKQLLVDERHLFVLEGWMEDSKVGDIREALEERLEKENFALVTEEVQEEEMDKVPIVLENNKVVTPFENITDMYSLPKYNEMDPTPFLTPFYLLFFGMMLADLGYGMLLFAATAVALKFFHFDKGMRKNLSFFHLLSYPTMIWGLIYGSFFGFELPFVLLSTMDDVNTILVLSIVFGVLQILLGLGLRTYLLLRDKDPFGAVAEGIGWIVIFVGIIMVLIANMVFPNAFVATLGQGIAIAGVVAILVASTLGSESKGLGFGSGLYNLYGITGYVGDIVSYTRLMALGVSGSSIALAFNMIIGFLPPVARFTVGILLFIALHSINFGLSLLSAYVHGARLIFVEFFGKFYEGGGKALNPLKTSEEYIELKNNYNR